MDHNHHHQHHMPAPADTTTMAPMDHDSMHHGHLMTAGSMDHMMKMYFHFGFEPVVLLQNWSAQTLSSLLLSCLFFFVLAVLYELLKAYRRLYTLRAQLNRAVQAADVRLHSSSVVNHALDCDSKPATNPSELTDQSLQINAFPNNHPCYGIRSKPDDISVCADTCPNNRASGSASGSSTGTTVPVVATYTSRCADSRYRLIATGSEMFNPSHLYSTLLYLVQVFIAYFLMLAFMLFNVWFCLAILLGAAFGHFILAHKTIALQDHSTEDHCH